MTSHTMTSIRSYVAFLVCLQYTLWFPRLFPGSGPLVVMKRVAFDQVINTGLWYDTLGA